MQFSIISAGLLLARLASATSAVSVSTKPKQPEKEIAMLKTKTSQGCFKSSKGLKDSNLDGLRASSAVCQITCQKLGKPVFALSMGITCYCGDTYPPQVDLTDDAECDFGCQAYPLEACGNINGTAFSVYNTGDKLSVPFYSDNAIASTSTSGSKTPVSTSTITGAIKSATGQAIAVSGGAPTLTESVAVATSSIPSSGSKSLLGAGVAIYIAVLAI